jgi:hypothetical protein
MGGCGRIIGADSLGEEAPAMEREGDEVHVNREEASGGVQPHIVRYVLGVSLLLVVLLMSAIWILGSVTR